MNNNNCCVYIREAEGPIALKCARSVSTGFLFSNLFS